MDKIQVYQIQNLHNKTVQIQISEQIKDGHCTWKIISMQIKLIDKLLVWPYYNLHLANTANAYVNGWIQKKYPQPQSLKFIEQFITELKSAKMLIQHIVRKKGW